MTSSPAVSPPPPPNTISETLSAVANMKRLLEAYRSLAPLTIGGPSSTSLETNQSPTPLAGRPLSDPRLMKKFAPYHFLMGPMLPPGGLPSQPGPHSMWTSGHGSATPFPATSSPRRSEASSPGESFHLHRKLSSRYCVQTAAGGHPPQRRVR